MMRFTEPPDWQMSGGFTLPRWKAYSVTFVLEQLQGNDSGRRDSYVNHLLTHVPGEKIFRSARNDNYDRLDHGWILLQHTKHVTQRWTVQRFVLYEGDEHELYLSILGVAEHTPSDGVMRLCRVAVAALE